MKTMKESLSELIDLIAVAGQNEDPVLKQITITEPKERIRDKEIGDLK